MAMKKEALTNFISDDLAKRNDNWTEIDNTFALKADKTYVDTRIDNIIAAPIDLPEIYVDEIHDARQGAGSLGANITEIKSQLAQTTTSIDTIINKPRLNNGLLILPSDFPKLPFEITRLGKRRYVHNATPNSIYNWKNATEVFLSVSGAHNNSGLTPFSSTTPHGFKQNVQNNVYGSQTDYIITFLDNVFNANTRFNDLNTLGINVLFRSGSLSKYTWVGDVKRVGSELSNWIREGNVFKSTLTASVVIYDLINTFYVDHFGSPNPYTKVDTLAECQQLNGSFYQSGLDIYCNPWDNERIDTLSGITSRNIMDIKNDGNIFMFENIGFLPYSYDFEGTSLEAEFYFFNSLTHRGRGENALRIHGLYKIFSFDSTSSYATTDGYNYHTTDERSLAVEINCVSYGNGKYKLDNSASQHSNNGSTAHNGMHMLRVGCEYWDCEGPPVADVNDCYSISIGCTVGSILDTTTAPIRSAFYLSDEHGTAKNKQFVIECAVEGKNIEFGIHGTENTYISDFEGSDKFSGVVHFFDWEEYVND